MITAIAIDDEPPALKVIETFCAEARQIQLLKAFTKPAEAVKFLQKSPVDLLFLDIRMPSVSGLDLYKTISSLSRMVIFTTAHTEYAIEGFNLNAVDYLLKPFTYERFQQALNKAKDYLHFLDNTHTLQKELFLQADYSLIKVSVADIHYIEGLDDYLKIHLQSTRKPVVVRMTMKAILEKLPEKEFVRVHRSFIIPFGRIDTIRNKTISLQGVDIPIGNSYAAGFYERFHA